MDSCINYDAILKEAFQELCFLELQDIERTLKEEKRQEYVLSSEKIKTKRLKLRYLLAAILILILSVGSVAAYEPIKGFLTSVPYTVNSDHVLIGHGDKEVVESFSLENDYNALIAPTSIPAQYELTENLISDEDGLVQLRWDNKFNDRYFISYIQCRADTNLYVTSNGEAPKTVMLGTIEAQMIVDDRGIRSIFYEDGSYTYCVTSRLNKNELIKIMMSLAPIDTIKLQE